MSLARRAGLLVGICAALFAISSAHSMAQENVPDLQQSVPGLGGASEVAAPDQRLELPINGTRELTLVAPVRDIIIGNPDIADVIIRSPTKLFIAGKRVGSTNLFLLDSGGRMIDHFQLSVHPDAAAAEDAVRKAFPDEQIEVAGAGDALVLRGSVSSDAISQQATTIVRRFVGGDAQIINAMRLDAEQQVLIKVSVAEVQKSALKELGLENLISPTTIGDLAIAGVTGGASAVVGGGAIGGGITSIANILNSSSTLTAAPAGALFIDGPGAIDTTVRILEQHGLAKKLAEPNLVAVSGEYATMLAGGEIPIPVSQEDGVITIEFRPFGVSLTFLPVVLDKGRISLKIATEVSAPTLSNLVSLGTDISVPSFVVRRANSTVELPSGGSIMMAGLLNNDITQSLRGVPGLMHIPILGALFRSTSFQQDESELVIVARAYLVQPTDPGVLALPTDGFAPASDLDLYLLGHLQNIYTNRQGSAQDQVPQLQGPVGYIIR
ncbi:MAG: type II and III secretion system protein family protein [Rhodospirillaceae bacterium]|nr:type II and III secretion system protein family protein [Rhodospirillaceae bacterium]